MNKFKIGDEVVIVRHTRDSDENYDIGDIDVLIRIGGPDYEAQPYCLSGEATEFGEWWVDAECLEFAHLSLENE